MFQKYIQKILKILLFFNNKLPVLLRNRLIRFQSQNKINHLGSKKRFLKVWVRSTKIFNLQKAKLKRILNISLVIKHKNKKIKRIYCLNLLFQRKAKWRMRESWIETKNLWILRNNNSNWKDKKLINNRWLLIRIKF